MTPLDDEVLKSRILIIEEMLRSRDGWMFDAGAKMLADLYMKFPNNYDILRIIISYASSDTRFGKTFLAQVMMLRRGSSGEANVSTANNGMAGANPSNKEKLIEEMLQLEKQKLEAEIEGLRVIQEQYRRKAAKANKK
jgi:hypothetical protein